MSKTSKSKIINDSVHGHIKFPTIAMALIDTPQFQRLRFLKQLGTLHFVFPNATNSRFQHSLGTGYLAKRFAKALQKQHKELIDDKDVLCVMLAGLCHDLGHGPFSHLWEAFVREAGSDWHHEDSSIAMLDYLIEENNLMPTLKSVDGFDDTDMLFIKELIAGPIDPDTGLPTHAKFDINTDPWPYRGRTEDKSFLYEIVSNKSTGIDVDKWDYILRDNLYLKIGVVFSYERFVKFSQIKEVEVGDLHRRRICLRDKESDVAWDMFFDRMRLHRHGYQHRVAKLLDRMIIDALLIADQHITIKGSDNRMLPLSKASEDVKALSKLSDEQVFFQILHSEDLELQPAREILGRIMSRDFYRTIAQIQIGPDDPQWEKSRGLGKEYEKDVKDHIHETSHGQLDPKDFFVCVRKVDCGMGDQNPLNNVPFYSKNQQNVKFMQASPMETELTLWICTRRSDEKTFHYAREAVKNWSENHAISNIEFDPEFSEEEIEIGEN